MSLAESTIVSALRARMRAQFGAAPAAVRIVRSPYRICPLGAHIDHQLGTVTALAIDQAVYLAFAPSGSLKVRLHSLNFPGTVEFCVDAVPPKIPGDWGNYARGAVAALNQRAPLAQGILGVISGDWSEGGLSSSSAVGVAYLLALESVNPHLHLNLNPNRNLLTPNSESRNPKELRIPKSETALPVLPAPDNIQLDQFIENHYLGLNNGILDQAAILCSRRNCLTIIDCRAYAQRKATAAGDAVAGIQSLPQPADMPPFVWLIAFSGLNKSLMTTAYNLRVTECAAAARILLDTFGRPETPALLGHLTPEEYSAERRCLAGPPAKRAAHFFSESARVRDGIAAWQTGDLAAFGRLMNEACQSSIENYECGSPPLIDLWRILARTPGVYGARFSGAGFRGCCVALANPDAATQAGPEILAAYTRLHPKLATTARVAICQSANGAQIIS